MVAKAGEIITDLEREYGFGGVFLVASNEQERRYKHLLFLLVSKVEQWVRRTGQPVSQPNQQSVIGKEFQQWSVLVMSVLLFSVGGSSGNDSQLYYLQPVSKIGWE